jgi:ribose transport system permease protein
MQSGVQVDRVRILAYVISGLCAAVAGLVLAGRNTNVPADLGTGYEIQAIAAAVIGGASLAGGRGRILGAVLGAFTLAATINIINLVGVPSSYQKIVIGSILLVAVLANRVSAVVSARMRAKRAARTEALSLPPVAPAPPVSGAPEVAPPNVTSSTRTTSPTHTSREVTR